jgi:hypothetical protein
MDVKVVRSCCWGDGSVAVQSREYGSVLGDNPDRDNGMTVDPFKGTVP